MRRPEVLAAAMAALVTSVICIPRASAQTAPPPAPPSPQAPASQPRAALVETADSAPNRAVIGTGLLAIGVWYVPSVIVGAKSPVASDGSLFVPIAGPWLDLADRPQCGPGSVSCRVETGNQVLLVMDGLFQAWGLTTAIVGIFLKEHARVATSVSVAPTRIGRRGYGLTAFATF
jgi:hypothetical protein